MIHEIYLMTSLITLFFVLLWTIRSPSITWEILTFKYKDSIEDRIMSILFILFAINSIHAIVVILKAFIKLLLS